MKKKQRLNIADIQSPIDRPMETQIEKKVEVEFVSGATKTIDVEPEIISQPVVEEMSEVSSDAANRYDYQNINTVPRNGTLVVVSITGADKGEIVFWKRTRAFANTTHRWEETGFFVNNITNMPISFKPNYWRSRSIYEV